ncbi:MAG: ornithine carbamoyltransferase [Acidobacteria bacterium]|nr:ornithine carbamoyltransferase [Acidobacteriota bacterium]
MIVELPALESKDFLSILNLSPESLEQALALAAVFKTERKKGRPHAHVLEGQHIALLFEKPSLRTHSAFTIAVRELGGDVIEPASDVAFSGRESASDVARNLERWVPIVVVRTFEQARLERFAASSSVMRVINALTDEEHPCQALADMQALIELWGSVKGRTITYVGDGNNVAASLAQASVMLGMHVRIATPEGFELNKGLAESVTRIARFGATLTQSHDPVEAVKGADAVYTDAWASMGQEDDAERRAGIFKPFQVNAALMAKAGKDALFMHCLPAHRGLEVTDEVIDSPASIVFDQSENRLHTQKALLAMMSAR